MAGNTFFLNGRNNSMSDANENDSLEKENSILQESGENLWSFALD